MKYEMEQVNCGNLEKALGFLEALLFYWILPILLLMVRSWHLMREPTLLRLVVIRISLARSTLSMFYVYSHFLKSLLEHVLCS